MLLIVTFRPEFDAALDRTAARDSPHPQSAGSSAKSSAMIDRVVGNKLLPASVRQDIIERTDGIPCSSRR